jgi:sigma-B regulation protein RsbU (phosphoserine phosphatase)
MTLPELKLTEMIPADALQRTMDSFGALTGYSAVVRDIQNQVLAETGDGTEAQNRSKVIQDLLVRRGAAAETSVSIRVGELRVGSLVLLGDEATKGGTDSVSMARRAAAVHFLHLLADTMAQVCRQGAKHRERMEELQTLLHLSKLLSGQRSLQEVLDAITHSTSALLDVKASTIRLLSEDKTQLTLESVHNLSRRYQHKGAVLVNESPLAKGALRGEIIYVADLAKDVRTLFPEDATREGIRSVLATGMIHRGKPVGIMRVYTEKVQSFSKSQMYMLRAIAQLAAAAIRNAQLDVEIRESVRIERQVQVAADVQRRLLPQKEPRVPPFRVTGRYEPCFEMGGDFYDFVSRRDGLGVAIGDVVGKGVPAAMLMATVRASLRAHLQDILDLDVVMARVNAALAHDTLDNEFATVFFGTFDPKTLGLTYCSAGHDPVLLIRNGKVRKLIEGGLPLGVEVDHVYAKTRIQLEPQDVFVGYTDGIIDAFNFDGERFGLDRVMKAAVEVADQPADDIANHILWEARRFVGMNDRFDDITLVVVKVEQPIS